MYGKSLELYQLKIFISYTHDGEEYVNNLEKDLKTQDITLYIYKKCVKPGEMWLKSIDEQLYQSDYCFGVITKDYTPSIGGDEAYAIISDGLSKKNMKFIPLFFIPIKEVKSIIIPALSGYDFSTDYKSGLYELIKFLKSEIIENPEELLTRIESDEPNNANPFRRTRTEFFFDDYKLLANAFAEPEKDKYDMIKESKPVIIFGGRGSGKTMILKSLIPEVIFSRYNIKTIQDAKKLGIDYFGIYFRLKRASFLIYDYHYIVEMGFIKTGIQKDYKLYLELIEKLKNNKIEDEPILTNGLNAAWVISVCEFNLKILQTVLENIKKLNDEKSLDLSYKLEEEITVLILDKLSIANTNIRNFNDLLSLVDKELKKIKNFSLNMAIPYAKPIIDWCQTDIEFLDAIFKILINKLPDFSNLRIYLLFDEFENLRPYQQTIINEWIKTSRYFTVKVAAKFEGMYTNKTLQGQPLQNGQDYLTWQLDYSLNDDNKDRYKEFLFKICKNLLTIEDYKEKDIKKILVEPKELELPEELINSEIKNIRISGGQDFDNAKLSDYRSKLEIAAIFRLLRKKEKVEGRTGKKKIYAGFDTYTYISSGIIRIFLNLAGMAFYKAEDNGLNIKNGETIPVEYQTWAANIVSKAWLEKIPDNSEEYGDKIYQFIIDVGDIFRERLLYHQTEPETLTIGLLDPYNLDSYYHLKQILAYSVRESILYERMESSSMKPKKLNNAQSKEYLLNRIYSPILEISYRSRWPRSCGFTTTELSLLLDYHEREKIKKQLLKKQHGKNRSLDTKLLSSFE